MSQSRTRKKTNFGVAPFVLDESDVVMARTLGLLRSDIRFQDTDSSKPDYGVVYSRRENVASETLSTQKAIQARCKEFAQACGFQLQVESCSTKPNHGGNAKYTCKTLNGQQFFDNSADSQDITCPFSINVNGLNGVWKVTRLNLAHNHIKHVGFSERPLAEGTVTRLATLTALVEAEMLPRYAGKTDKMTGAAISSFLLGKGSKVARSAVSRIKAEIDYRLRGDREDSYRKLESYLRLMAEKNPGSGWKFEKGADGTFERACFIPSIGIRVAKMARPLYGFDGTHLKGEMNNYGVFLVATTKDYNQFITPFAFSLVPVENKDNWTCFLGAIKSALADDKSFAALSDRHKDLVSAVDSVFPNAGHRFCLRHIKGNIGLSLTKKERVLISKMAKSDCENDYKLFASELRVTKPAVVDYLDQIDKKHWVKYVYLDHYKIPTFGETTSNLAEQANSWIGNECRSVKPFEAFGLFLRKLSELTRDRRLLPGCSRVMTRIWFLTSLQNATSYLKPQGNAM